MTVIALCSKEIDFLGEIIVYTLEMHGAFIYIGGTLLMNSEKTIRDPMYGYITIESPFAQLIDTEEFQRLRNIRRPHISHRSQLLLRHAFPYARFLEPRAYKCVVYHTNKSPADEVFLTCIVCAFCSCFNILNVQPPIYL